MTQILKREPALVNPLYAHPDELRCSLSGDWLFRLDPSDVGVKERWFLFPFLFQEYIQVPGCWQGQGFGSDQLEKHKEFDTEIRAFRATYEGTGWYARSFTVPSDFAGKRIWLNFGGSNPTTEVWLNGTRLGEHHFPFLSFGFDITDLVKRDGENFLAVRISEEDRLLGLTYYYSGKWSGLYRDVELTATGDAYINAFSVYPSVDSGEVLVKATVVGDTVDTVLSVTVTSPSGEALSGEAETDGDTATVTFTVEEPALWSPDAPTLYRVDAVLTKNNETCDVRADRFGFVTLTTEGKHFCINHEPYYMRGTGDFHDDPKTGSPNTDRDHWRKCLKALRDMGYNYVRCQSFVPVPEYFDAADEVGLLIQSEMGMLAPMCGKSVWHAYNWPIPTPNCRETLREQWNGIVLRDVNHPSANLYCMSNEQTDTAFPKTAWRCYYETKALKPTALVIWTDGFYKPQYPSDFANAQSDKDEICDKPLIQHEYMWWSSYPDVRLAEKYKGGALRHFAADMAIKSAAKYGYTHILPQAAVNSQRLQFIEAKCKMEQKRRDCPTLAGICHFNAMDIGMSAQGVIDIFYEQKYATPEQWRQSNGDTVIMNSLNFDDRVLTGGAEWSCDFFVSDFSHPAFTAPTLKWSIGQGEAVLVSGTLEYNHEAYRTVPIGTVTWTVPESDTAKQVTLRAELCENDRTVKNEWDLWIFPAAVELPNGVYRSKDGEISAEAQTIVTPRLTEALVAFAKDGGTVILTGSEGLVRPFSPILHLTKGRYFFTRPASYPIYEELQSGTIIQDHPIFGAFPHDSHADLQFYNMIAESPALDLEGLDLVDKDPIIRSLHSYQIGRPLGYMVERRLGKGRIIVLSLKLRDELPESMYLLREITRYTQSGKWAEAAEILPSTIEKLISGTNIDY